MGDEPYAALLPWAVFAVVDRATGSGPFWAALAALITAGTVLATSTHGRGRSRDIIVPGAIVWFTGLAVAGAVSRSGASFVVHDGRAISAAGFAVIAFGSLAFVPAVEHYTRPHVRPDRWDDPAFRHFNVLVTVLWGSTFALVSLSHLLAASLDTTEGATVLNWVVPIALAALAAHRTRIVWDEFNDDDEFEPDPMRDLALDWEPPTDAQAPSGQ